MNISQNLETFRLFAATMQDGGKESAVVRAVESPLFGRKGLQISVATKDKAYAFTRSDAEKAGNVRTRDIFFKTVAKEFGGEKFIPEPVKKVMTNFGGASDKPLTARRIVAVCDAVIKEKSAIAAASAAIKPAAPAKSEAASAKPPSGGQDANKELYAPMSKFASVVKDSEKPSLLGGFFSFFSEPKPKVFTIADGKLAYEDMPDEPNAATCRKVREGLVKALFNELTTKGKIEENVANYVIDSIKSSLLDESVAGTPLKVDDPVVKDALNIFEGLKLGKEYNDSVSKKVLNRGTLKMNTTALFEKIVAPALCKALGDKGIALFSDAKASVGDDGYFSVTFDNARFNKDWEMLSKIDDALPRALNCLATMLKDHLADGFADLTLKIKPEYDARTGAINLTVKVPTSSEFSNILNTVATFRTTIEETAQDKIGVGDKREISAVPLTEDEKKDTSVLMKVAVNLRHFGTEKLGAFGLNTSIAGNITDVKLTKNGLTVQIGDNPGTGKAEDAGQAGDGEAVDGNDMSLNVVPSAVSPMIEQLLRGKVGFSFMSISTAGGQNGAPGTMKLSIKDLDIPALTASKTGAGFALLRKLGVLQVSDIDIEIRPSLDPVSNRIRLDVTGLSGTGAVGGVRGSLARKLLSTILPAVMGDIGGVGFVPGKDILSVTVDARRFLAKVVPDPEKLIPGGIPSISEFSANENGFKIGVKCRTARCGKATGGATDYK